MAPTITAAMSSSQEHLTLSHKLRKPLVEKLRRERINSSIEQLKSLLGPEFLKQQPDSKLEKADVLEMTVCVLRRLQQQQQHPAVDQGYSRCVREVVHFLSKDQVKTQTQRKLETAEPLQQPAVLLRPEPETDLRPQTSFTKDEISSAVWRPW